MSRSLAPRSGAGERERREKEDFFCGVQGRAVEREVLYETERGGEVLEGSGVRVGRVRTPFRRRRVQREHVDPSRKTYLKMPEILFPEKWWKMTPEEYNEAKLALKGLIAKDPDSGNAEVKKFFGEGEE